jgi:hypothetical protein
MSYLTIVVGAFLIITVLIRHKRRWKVAGKLGFFSFSIEADDD